MRIGVECTVPSLYPSAPPQAMDSTLYLTSFDVRRSGESGTGQGRITSKRRIQGAKVAVSGSEFLQSVHRLHRLKSSQARQLRSPTIPLAAYPDLSVRPTLRAFSVKVDSTFPAQPIHLVFIGPFLCSVLSLKFVATFSARFVGINVSNSSFQHSNEASRETIQQICGSGHKLSYAREVSERMITEARDMP